MIRYLDELEGEDLKGKRVLLRLDLNVAVENGKVFDDFDLQKIIPTVDFLREKEARTIIIAHIEDSNGEATTLLPVLEYLNGYFKTDFCPTYFTPESVEKLLALQDKGVLLFENLRINEGEKKNDPEFTKKLAQMGDIYVNDAFGVSHRKHSSIVGLPELLPHYAGLLMRQEIEHLSHAFNPGHPFAFILGGAKFETKLPIIKKYLDKADSVFVGGALANDIFKARGLEVGTSLVSKGDVDENVLTNPKIITPVDVTVTNKLGDVSFKKPEEVLEDDCIVDVGPETVNQLQALLDGAKTLVWNGPLGNYEAGFKDKTEHLAEIVAELTTQNGLESIIGGGDTVASINTLGLDHKFSFVSTGGGAMLDYLVNETLPGIEALK